MLKQVIDINPVIEYMNSIVRVAAFANEDSVMDMQGALDQIVTLAEDFEAYASQYIVEVDLA